MWLIILVIFLNKGQNIDLRNPEPPPNSNATCIVDSSRAVKNIEKFN